MAKATKKTVKKRKAKKARKASRAGAKRAVAKKTRKTAKQTVKKAGKKAAKKAVKKPAKKLATKAAKKSVRKAPAKKAPVKKTPVKKTTAQAAPSKKAKADAKPKASKPSVKTSQASVAASTPAPKAPAARSKNSFYITTAIAYPNGAPHIGHAYEAIATDALARFQRLDGKDVFFLTGTDEHGLKMIQTAEAEKLTPMEVATRNAQRFKEMDQRLNISFDRFIRTTEEQHHRSSQEIWNRMVANGDIYLDSYSGWYSVRDEAYYAEEETTLGEDNVRRGPQGSPVEWVEEKSYFFRLSAYQDRLLRALRVAAGFHRAGFAQERSGQLRQRRIARPFDFAHHLRLGRQGARRSRARDVCLGRCAHQLHHRRRLSRRGRRRTGTIGRPTCTSSARTSSASMLCTGLPS